MRWTSVLAVLLVMGCAPPGSAPNSPADVITPSQANRVVADYWTQNEKANVASDPALLEAIESGPALIMDQALATRNAKLNHHLAEARPLRKVTVYVPHQSRYPAEFTARIDTVNATPDGKVTTETFTFFNVFEKGAPGQKWKSTFFVPPAPGETITIAIANDGYAARVPLSGSGQTVPPGKLSQVVADYLNSASAGLGTDDSQLDGTLGIDGIVRGQRLSIEGARRSGFTLTGEAAPGPGVAHAYRSAQGSAVVFFAVSSQVLAKSARDGACIIQDKRLHLPPEVPPGNYGRVENKILALMIGSDPAATKGKATVRGFTSVSYDFVVEPSPGSCIDNSPPASV
jgi:hypothetical protein